MTPTETRHFRILASYSSAIDYLSADPRTEDEVGRKGEREREEGDIQSHLIYELSEPHPFLAGPQIPHSTVT